MKTVQIKSEVRESLGKKYAAEERAGQARDVRAHAPAVWTAEARAQAAGGRRR